jgi:hypothetical protein
MAQYSITRCDKSNDFELKGQIKAQVEDEMHEDGGQD